MTAPRPSQMRYLTDLVKDLADREDKTHDDVFVELGVKHRHPFSGDIVFCTLSAAYVSGVITIAKRNLGRVS